MSKRKLEIAIHLLNLIAISTFLVSYINHDYPKVGHDYRYFIPTLLDTYLHYKVNGLSIQWYTPSFGGGLPAYPNPEQIQFSLPQTLTFLTSPWNASLVSTVIFALAGYFAMYYFLSKTLSLSWQASVLGGLFFTLNGFFIEHVVVGHLGFQVFPLLAVMGTVIFSNLLPEILSAIFISLLFALLVNESGFYPIVIFILSLLITLPILYLCFPDRLRFKRLARVIILGLFFTVLLTGSKIYAVYSFMRFFPRTISDYYTTSPLLGIFGIFLQLLGPMNLVPLLKLAGGDPNLLVNYMLYVTRAMYGYWEFDTSMSPIALGIIFIGAYGVLRNIRKKKRLFLSDKKWVAWILLLFSSWLTVEFILAKGLFYPLLETLPIMSSLHVNPRYTAAFLFPLALTAAIFYDRWATQWSSRKSLYLFLALDVLTLIPLYTYFMIKTDFQYRLYDITTSQTIYDSIRSGDTLTITGIVSGTGNTDALLLHESNLEPDEPVFGYFLENFHPEIAAGSIWNVSGGYYNMTDPSGYVFPEINGTRPFERIPVSDKNKLEAFANHKQPDWKIPLSQRILDWVSGSIIVIFAAILALVAFQKLRMRAFR